MPLLGTLTVDVESDGRFTTLCRIRLVKGNASQRLPVVRLVEPVRQRGDGHPRFRFANVRRVGLVVVAGEFRFAEEPLDVSRRVAAAAHAANGSLLAVGQRQIAAVYHGSQLKFELRRVGRNCGNNGNDRQNKKEENTTTLSHGVKLFNSFNSRSNLGTFDKFFPGQL